MGTIKLGRSVVHPMTTGHIPWNCGQVGEVYVHLNNRLIERLIIKGLRIRVIGQNGKSAREALFQRDLQRVVRGIHILLEYSDKSKWLEDAPLVCAQLAAGNEDGGVPLN